MKIIMDDVNQTAIVLLDDMEGSANHATHITVPIHTYVLLSICYACIFVMGVAGNIVVIAITTRYQDMRGPTNVGMMSLAIADLLILIVCMPTALAEFYGRDQWLFGDFMCEYNETNSYD